MKTLLSIVLLCLTFICRAQTELISDGDFSTYSSAWHTSGNLQYTTFNPSLTNYNSPYGYSYLAAFSGYPADNISGSLYQDFFVPSGTLGVNISFYYRITTAETTSTISYDTCRVMLVDLSTGSSVLLARMSNLHKNSAYLKAAFPLASLPDGRTWRILFLAGNDASLPTVFRIDDISALTFPSAITTCISWAGGIHPSSMVDSAMGKLCAYSIIPNSQNVATLSSPISRLEVARYVGKALVGSADISFLDNFPSIFPALQTLSVTDQRYVKLMLFLEYPSALSPSLGTDGIAPYSRDCYYPNFSGAMKKSDVIKAMLEAWNLSPSMLYYDPALSTYSPMICDMFVSNKNLGWVQRALPLGLLSRITTPCGTGAYLNEASITYSDFYVMLSRLIDITPSPIGYDAFFVPNLFYLNNGNQTNSIEKGVFSEYSDNGFNIPSGGVGLTFQHSYHSNLTEIPYLYDDTDIENNYLKPKLQPLGGGWTHSYSAHIKSLGTLGIKPDRILIYWPDGSVHSFLVTSNKYETKGVYDKLFIDSYNIYNQPSKVTIRKGRTIYTFRNIDPVIYNTLSLASITNAQGDILDLQYVNGYSLTPGLEPKLLDKVTDIYSARSLTFSYWPGTNYLQSVIDPIGRKLTFYVNKYNHDLDSASDAMGQNTAYSYDQFVGTYAYRTHLLTGIRKPKGNNITNKYFSRKLSQTAAANYRIYVSAVPVYTMSATQQQSNVSRIQGGDTIKTRYIFDTAGNIIQTSNANQSVSYVIEAATNRVLIERDRRRGFITKYGYDVNGYLNKKVVVDSLFTDSTVNEYTNNVYGEIINTKDYNDPSGIVTETKDYRRAATGQDSIIVTNEGLGGEIRHQFSYTGNLLNTYVSPSSQQISYTYNGYGNVVQIDQYPSGGGFPISEKYGYDGVSRIVAHTDHIGNNTGYAYDNNDNVTDVTVDPGGLNLTTHNSYDQNGNITSIKSPKSHSTTLKYDFNTDDFIEENDGTDRKRWRYNNDGTLDTFISKNNVPFKYTYYGPAMSSDTTLYGLLYSDGYSFRKYWDSTKNLYFINNSSGKANHFWYDTRQRGKWNKPWLVSTDGFFTPGTPDNVFYDYDRMMRPAQIAYPAFGSTSYSFSYCYDWTTKKLALVQNTSTHKNYVKYSYANDGAPVNVSYGNGDSIFYHYDKFNRLDSIWAKNQAGTILYGIGAELDKNGSHTRENLSIYYGGVLDTTLPPLTVGDTASSSYQLRNRIITGEGKTFSADNDGNVITSLSPTINYTWSKYGQLDSVDRGGVITGYDYDPLGIRRRKNNSYYVVDQECTGNVIMEATASCIPINVYVWGSNGLVCRIDPVNDSTFYYHYDFRGSVIGITNQNGDMVQFYKYEPFGKVYKKGGHLTWQNPYQYVGREGVQSDDSDLYYMKARYYQPSTGRFVSEDPKWNTNLFTYCNNDPVNNIDPNGEFLETILDLASIGYSAYQLAASPSLGNLGMLAWDIGAAALPFIPGSYIKRGAEAAKVSIKAVSEVEQYSLRATKSGFYPVMERGFSTSQGVGWLQQGDVWKFGTTKNPATRYSQKFLDDFGLKYQTEFSGNLMQAKTLERMKILNYKERTGYLLWGNKIIR